MDFEVSVSDVRRWKKNKEELCFPLNRKKTEFQRFCRLNKEKETMGSNGRIGRPKGNAGSA